MIIAVAELRMEAAALQAFWLLCQKDKADGLLRRAAHPNEIQLRVK